MPSRLVVAPHPAVVAVCSRRRSRRTPNTCPTAWSTCPMGIQRGSTLSLAGRIRSPPHRVAIGPSPQPHRATRVMRATQGRTTPSLSTREAPPSLSCASTRARSSEGVAAGLLRRRARRHGRLRCVALVATAVDMQWKSMGGCTAGGTAVHGAWARASCRDRACGGPRRTRIRWPRWDEA